MNDQNVSSVRLRASPARAAVIGVFAVASSILFARIGKLPQTGDRAALFVFAVALAIPAVVAAIMLLSWKFEADASGIRKRSIRGSRSWAWNEFDELRLLRRKGELRLVTLVRRSEPRASVSAFTASTKSRRAFNGFALEQTQRLRKGLAETKRMGDLVVEIHALTIR